MDLADVIRTVGTTSGVRANISSALEDDLGSQHTTYNINKMGLNMLVGTLRELANGLR